jgi:hypothetical protein
MYYNMEGERRRRQVPHRQARELLYKVFSTSSVKQKPACQPTTLPKLKTFVYIGPISLFLLHPPSFMSVSIVDILIRNGEKSKYIMNE